MVMYEIDLNFSKYSLMLYIVKHVVILICLTKG